MSKRNDRIEAVKSCTLFSDMPAEFVERALSGMRMLNVEAGGTILAEDQPAHALGVIALGEAAVYKNAGEGKLLISVLPTGSIIGAATLFSNHSAATEIRARKRSSVAFFDEEVIAALMRENFGFTLRYVAYLTERIHFLTHRIESIGCTTATDKLLNYLLQSGGESGHSGRGFRLPISMAELAGALGMSRASLYRAMDTLIDSGRVWREGKMIYLL